MRITLFDYGAGNLHSLAKALDVAGAEVRIEEDPARAVETDALVLPGVGAFPAAAARLAPARGVVRDAVRGGLPTLGICLGMQLLFDSSEEGEGAGLGVVPGVVRRLRARRVPQIGWNEVEMLGAPRGADPLLAAAPVRVAYYANSFVCEPADPSCVTAWSSHEDDRFAAAVRLGSAVGVQFHPEKSSDAGVRFVRAFVASVRERR
jgi:imidazole glycerol-phosphate synthase subunit HisH